MSESSATLTHEERASLLELARGALAAYFEGALRPVAPRTPRFLANGAAFVTLRSETGDLRGCIGTTRFERPLGEVVPELAVAAACEDRRFEPVAKEELGSLRVSLSVLTPLSPARIDAID